MQLNRQIKVGLVQIGDRFGEQYYFPYSIGLLQAYAQKNLKNQKEFIFLLPIYKRIRVDEAVRYLSEADIVFFSTYIWNYKINLEIAKRVKQNKNNCIIVFGGPQVPESAKVMKTFLKNHHFIDIASYGEGEVPFLRILENFKKGSWENVPSIGFFTEDDYFMYNPQVEGNKSLNTSVSPYSQGIFDSLIKANPQDSWSGLIETNRGCPFSCAYCYWGRRPNKKVYLHDLETVFKEIDWFSQKKIEFVFCCDANFGLFKRDFDIVKKVMENKRKYGYPMAFSVQNTKNSTEKIFRLQKTLNDVGLQKGVNLALQSLNEETLKSINRSNISNKVYEELQIMFTRNKIPTFSDLILCLPNESYDTFTNGTSNLIERGQHNRLQFINLMVLENTTMAEPAYQKKYDLIIKKSKIVSHHTSLDNEPEISEVQKLVIGTKTMPKKDWIKTRVFCWMISLLHFNKLLQIPFILLNKIYSVSYKELTEIFTEKSKKYRQISEILSFFTAKAKKIQNGDCEYVASKEWLNIWWPADEYMFIKLFLRKNSEAFYNEAESAINDFIKEKKLKLPKKLLSNAIRFNKSLIKLPFIKTDLDISLDYNIFEMYQGVLNGIDIPLESGVFNYIIDRTSNKWTSWEEWFREVVWYGTKRGAYLYDCKRR